jgi:hypothetical protein
MGDYPVFLPLKRLEQLNAFKIVDGTIEWDCGADLSPDTFYLESKYAIESSERGIVLRDSNNTFCIY